MAQIVKVTFTGTDNHTSIPKMVELCHKYPFIEFGILTKRQFWGCHDNHIIEFEKERYPSIKWIRELVGRFVIEGLRNHLSLHICPPLTYKIFKDLSMLNNFDGFARVQLNSAPSKFDLDGFYHCNFALNKQIIIQLNGEEPERFYRNSHYYWRIWGNSSIEPVFGLFENSGGRGVLANVYRKPLLPHMMVGYAGGLNPDNLEEEIAKIKVVSDGCDIWLDMETGVITDNNFDLEKVEKCCEIVKGGFNK